MYESHFGFTGSPFQLNPDPAFYFDSRGHSNALAYLKFGAHQGEGFIVVTGEIGAGKTTLVRTLLEGLDPQQVVAAQVVSTQLESNELLQAILMAFGIPSSSTSKAHLIANLEGYFTALAAKGRRALLIIDEAQNLKHEAVEELRMLSNFQLGKYGLLQSFLVGQPELRALLQSKSMEQLRQRVIASCHLGPLDQAETRAYVEHRLRRVGWNGSVPQFAGGVLDRVHYWTGGVPRKINRLCNRMLLGAFLANAPTISMALVDETATELRNEIGENLGAGLAPLAAPTEVAATVAASEPVPSAAQTPLPAFDPLVVSARAESTLPAAASGSAPADAPLPASPETTAAAAAQIEVEPSLPINAVANVATVETSPESSSSTRAVITRRAYREASSSRPLLCLVDSTTHFLMAGALQGVFQQFPSLPSVVVLNVGSESSLWSAELETCGFAMPASALHLGADMTEHPERVVRAVAALNDVFEEVDPVAVLILGSSDESLAGAVLASKRRLRVLRIGSGQRDLHGHSARQLNAVLIERMADLHFTDSTASFYALYREGIHLDRVRSVGNLAREVLEQSPVGNRSLLIRADLPESPLGIGLVSLDLAPTGTDDSTLGTLVATVCELGRQLPLVWVATGPDHERLLASPHLTELQAACVSILPDAGSLSNLAWLRRSRCLVTRENGRLLADALSMRVPTFMVDIDDRWEARPALPTELSDGKVSAPRPSPLERVLTDPAPVDDAPTYWHTGTASRIAAHLVTWLPGHTAPATPINRDTESEPNPGKAQPDQAAPTHVLESS
jgi:general secretion pathway protein A